jgi:hypothetical protein
MDVVTVRVMVVKETWPVVAGGRAAGCGGARRAGAEGGRGGGADELRGREPCPEFLPDEVRLAGAQAATS